MVRSMSSKVESLVQEFVSNLRQAIAQDAAEMFRLAAGGATRGKPGPKPKAAGALARKAKTGTLKRKGGKRTSAEIEAQAATILDRSRHAGLRLPACLRPYQQH